MRQSKSILARLFSLPAFTTQEQAKRLSLSTLVVNENVNIHSDKINVNISTQVNSASIRRETYNGREHFVIPSFTLPAGVIMNGGLYTSSEIDKHYHKLEGTLAPLGHPYIDGKPISAFSPEAINTNHVGAFNRNVKKVGNRVSLEKWLDIIVANSSENGRRLVERLEAIERGEDVAPVHTSVAVFLDREPVVNNQGYDWKAKIYGIDHDAILLDEPGAATPADGVGLLVNSNADAAKLLQTNDGALVGETYRDKEQRLSEAARLKFASGEGMYAWVADFTDDQVVLSMSGGETKVYGYKVESGRIVFDQTGAEVQRKESWVAKIAPALNQWMKHCGINVELPLQKPVTPNGKEDEMTEAEMQNLVSQVSVAVNKDIKEQIAPILQDITELKNNHAALNQSLTANARAEEATMREAVKMKHGEIVANALSGDALKAMFEGLTKAAPLGAGSLQENKSETGVPGADYFSGVKNG